MTKRKTTRRPSETLLKRIADPKARAERRRGVEAARLRLELAQKISASKLREAAGLSQTALAELVGTRQPNISRLESGEAAGLPSLDLLNRVATALDGRLEVRIIRKRHRASRKRSAKAET